MGDFIRERYHLVLTALYVALVVIAPFTAFKVVNLWGVTFAAGLLSTLLSFQLLDVANEIDGKGSAKTIVYTGLLVKGFLYLFWLPLIVMLPATDPAQAAQFAEVFGVALRVFIATEVVAVTMHLLLDIRLFAWLKERMHAPFFVRSALTNLVSWTLAAFIFVFVAFYGTPRFGFDVILGHVVVRFPLMVAYTLATSAFVRYIKRV